MNEVEFEESIVAKCQNMSVEDLSLYIIRCLKELNGKKTGRRSRPISRKRETYEKLIALLSNRQDCGEISHSFGKKLKKDLHDMRKVISKEFNEFVGLGQKSSKGSTSETIITIYADLGSEKIDEEGICGNCGVNFYSGWIFNSSIGQFFVCAVCRFSIFMELRDLRSRTSKPKKKVVDMWSRMVFSGFESNRRRH